jgi:hypothetical protein
MEATFFCELCQEIHPLRQAPEPEPLRAVNCDCDLEHEPVLDTTRLPSFMRPIDVERRKREEFFVPTS